MIRVLAALVVVAVIAGGCASRAAARAPQVATPAPPPFSDRELADEFVRQGVGAPKDAPTTTPRPGEDVPTEIRQTPRTDAIGTEAYNPDLSRRRAEAVAQELVARSIQRDRLTAEGFGTQRPVARNTLADGKDNPVGRALNRRVEAVVQVTESAPR